MTKPKKKPLGPRRVVLGIGMAIRHGGRLDWISDSEYIDAEFWSFAVGHLEIDGKRVRLVAEVLE